jgi:hypothetical protein
MKSLMEFFERVWAEILRRIGLAELLAPASDPSSVRKSSCPFESGSEPKTSDWCVLLLCPFGLDCTHKGGRGEHTSMAVAD